MNSLTQEILSSYDARVEGVAQIRNATQAQLGEFHQAHHAMARQQRAELAHGRAGLASSVAGQLAELDRAHHAMARQQRAELAHGRAELGASVSAQRQGYHEEQAEARAAWGGMAATLAARRGGAAAVAEPLAPPVAKSPAPVQPPVAAPVPAPPVAEAPVEEDEAVARAEVGEVTAEFMSLRDATFEHLANHPDGTRLVEIERELGLSRLPAARVVRNLMDEGKVEKRGLLYFAI